MWKIRLSPNETHKLKNRKANPMNIQNSVNDTKYINQVLILPWIRGNVVEPQQWMAALRRRRTLMAEGPPSRSGSWGRSHTSTQTPNSPAKKTTISLNTLDTVFHKGTEYMKYCMIGINKQAIFSPFSPDAR